MANLRSLSGDALISLAKTAMSSDARNLTDEIENEIIRRDDRVLDAAYMNAASDTPVNYEDPSDAAFHRRVMDSPTGRGRALWAEGTARP